VELLLEVKHQQLVQLVTEDGGARVVKATRIKQTSGTGAKTRADTIKVGGTKLKEKAEVMVDLEGDDDRNPKQRMLL